MDGHAVIKGLHRNKVNMDNHERKGKYKSTIIEWAGADTADIFLPCLDSFSLSF